LQRFRHQVRQHQRLGLGLGQRTVRARRNAHGRPVAPRNIFPSNIQGMPTWYELRVSGAGWLGRRGGCDLMVAMNPQTWDRDIAEIAPGGYLLLRLDQGPAQVAFPRRHHGARHTADRDVQRNTAIRASASCSRTSCTSARWRRCSTWK
jgi:Pyruvate/2-oxoacid:ferredoxin oxidoreductase gamma subunit